jgi:hypothetical protein
MQEKKKLVVLLSSLAFLFSSCTKPGLGGDNTLVVYPQHHTKPIFSHLNYRDTVYVKYNATELPGINPKNYDKIFIGEIGEEHVHIHGLERGKYFLFATGYDTTISARVSGGIGITLSDKTAETIINVPVTE